MFTVAATRAAERRQSTRLDDSASSAAPKASSPHPAAEHAELVHLLGKLRAAGFEIREHVGRARWAVSRKDQHRLVRTAAEARAVLDRALSRAKGPAAEGVRATPDACIAELGRLGLQVARRADGRYLVMKGQMIVRSLSLAELRIWAYPGKP